MKRILLYSFLAFFFIFILYPFKKDFFIKLIYPNHKIIQLKIGRNQYRLLVADNKDKWQQGLMNFRFLIGVDGMIFLFPDKKPRAFWNKNTYLDLEVIWFNGEKIIKKDFLPSIKKTKDIKIIYSIYPVDKVIELNQSKNWFNLSIKSTNRVE